jgi:hypothetical protein
VNLAAASAVEPLRPEPAVRPPSPPQRARFRLALNVTAKPKHLAYVGAGNRGHGGSSSGSRAQSSGSRRMPQDEPDICPFNPDLFQATCVNTRSISADGNKYFAGGVLVGMGFGSLVPPSSTVYLRAAPFLIMGTVGIVADWWESTSVCTEETRDKLRQFQQQAGAITRGERQEY